MSLNALTSMNPSGTAALKPGKLINCFESNVTLSTSPSSTAGSGIDEFYNCEKIEIFWKIKISLCESSSTRDSPLH